MVMINGEEKEIAGKNLLEYLKENGFNPEQLVVERNFEIISKEQFGLSLIHISEPTRQRQPSRMPSSA